MQGTPGERGQYMHRDTRERGQYMHRDTRGERSIHAQGHQGREVNTCTGTPREKGQYMHRDTRGERSIHAQGHQGRKVNTCTGIMVSTFTLHLSHLADALIQSDLQTYTSPSLTYTQVWMNKSHTRN
jgi:hypothetical protein